jgi:hypothetical protein
MDMDRVDIDMHIDTDCLCNVFSWVVLSRAFSNAFSSVGALVSMADDKNKVVAGATFWGSAKRDSDVQRGDNGRH